MNPKTTKTIAILLGAILVVGIISLFKKDSGFLGYSDSTNSYKNISTSTLVSSISGSLSGITINSHSSGTVKIYDVATATTTGADLMHNTITLSAVATTGERSIQFNDEVFNRGLYVVTTGTVDLTVQYK
jgi:hypothetical protein